MGRVETFGNGSEVSAFLQAPSKIMENSNKWNWCFIAIPKLAAGK